MKQLYLFTAHEQQNSQQKKMVQQGVQWHVYIDGAARKNPGPAGIGVYCLRNGTITGKYGFFVGVKTNNQAEYLALLMALYIVLPQLNVHDTLEILSDSLLLVKQVNKEYAIKHPELRPLYFAAQQQLEPIAAIVTHIIREKNAIADELANKGIDKKIPVPHEFSLFLRQHNILLSVS